MGAARAGGGGGARDGERARGKESERERGGERDRSTRKRLGRAMREEAPTRFRHAQYLVGAPRAPSARRRAPCIAGRCSMGARRTGAREGGGGERDRSTTKRVMLVLRSCSPRLPSPESVATLHLAWNTHQMPCGCARPPCPNGRCHPTRRCHAGARGVSRSQDAQQVASAMPGATPPSVMHLAPRIRLRLPSACAFG